jgi:hypothetical protein
MQNFMGYPLHISFSPGKRMVGIKSAKNYRKPILNLRKSFTASIRSFAGE